MNDPRRLTDDPDVPTSVRQALANERGATGLVDLDAGWAKLRAAAAASTAAIPATAAEAATDPAPASESPAAARAELGLGASRLIRWGIGLTAVAAVGAAWSIAGTPAPAPMTEAPGSDIAAPRALPIEGPSTVEAAAVTSPPAHDQAASVSVNALPAAPASASRIRVAAKPAAVDDDALREELSQIAKIRALVGRDPAAALALAEDGQRRFAKGHLVEEREGLSVIALVRLGRRDEARARAKTFADRYPKSALVSRIHAELEEVP